MTDARRSGPVRVDLLHGRNARHPVGRTEMHRQQSLLRVAHHAAVDPAIKSFRHKGLRALFETGSAAGVQPNHAKRLRMQLAALDTAQTIEDMALPGFRLHAVKRGMLGRWAIVVSGNWRMTFEFRDGNAYVLDYEDYH